MRHVRFVPTGDGRVSVDVSVGLPSTPLPTESPGGTRPEVRYWRVGPSEDAGTTDPRVSGIKNLLRVPCLRQRRVSGGSGCSPEQWWCSPPLYFHPCIKGEGDPAWGPLRPRLFVGKGTGGTVPGTTSVLRRLPPAGLSETPPGSPC